MCSSDLQAVLETAGVIVHRVDRVEDLVTTADHGLQLAFASRCRVAVLLSQRLLGTKDFARGDK